MGRRGAEGAVAEEMVEEGAVEAELERCQLGREGKGQSLEGGTYMPC